MVAVKSKDDGAKATGIQEARHEAIPLLLMVNQEGESSPEKQKPFFGGKIYQILPLPYVLERGSGCSTFVDLKSQSIFFTADK